MGNFASSAEWIHKYEAVPAPRFTISPCSLPTFAAKQVMSSPADDLVSQLVADAITKCKQSLRCVFSRAVDALNCSADIESESESDSEYGYNDDVLDEFQIVYEDNYASATPTKTTHHSQEDTTGELFKDTPWFMYSPCDFETFQTETTGKWNTPLMQDDDEQSATTESTEWLSETDDTKSENPASTCSDLDSLEFYDESDDVETKAACLLRLASNVGEETLLFVEDYLCKCGKCPLYETIEEDVARLVPWHDPEELIGITRILQAFCTYNEALGYHPDMITTADECLRIWCGDEDQAFSSFVVLHDDVPFLCAGTL